jgi:hypothetical protein
VSRSRELEALPAALRPLPLAMMRRVIFAAYREAAASGAGDEAAQVLLPSTARRIT